MLILSAFCYFAILAVSFATFLLSPCVVLAGHHQTLPLCGAAFPRMPSPASCGAFATFRFLLFAIFAKVGFGRQRAYLVKHRRCCRRHGGLQWFQIDHKDQSCWRLTSQREIFPRIDLTFAHSWVTRFARLVYRGREDRTSKKPPPNVNRSNTSVEEWRGSRKP